MLFIVILYEQRSRVIYLYDVDNVDNVLFCIKCFLFSYYIVYQIITTYVQPFRMFYLYIF